MIDNIFSLEKFKNVLESLKVIKTEPTKCFYTDNITYGKILDSMMTEPNYMVYMPLGAINLFVDNNIEFGLIIYCEPGLYDIWKRLIASPFVDKNDKNIDLWKIADSLFQHQKAFKDELLNGSPYDFNPDHIRGVSPIESLFKRFNDKK